MISCEQCGNPCGVGAKLCRRCEELNKIYPLAPGARRWVSPGAGTPQNLPRVDFDPTQRYRKDEPGYIPTMYGGNLVENLVQTAAAELALEAATAGFEPAGDGALSDTFSGGGGDFGGGGASGDF